MPQLLLGIVIVIILVANARTRRMIMHPLLLRTLFFSLGIILVLIIVGVLGYYGWQQWQKRQQKAHGTRWQDATIWQDLTPKTPKTGPPSKPREPY